jgi:hypothetical protein
MSFTPKRKKQLFILPLLLIAVFVFARFVKPGIPTEPAKPGKEVRKAASSDSAMQVLYDSLQLESKGLSRYAYNHALCGMRQLAAAGKLKNDGIISIADFSLPSASKRLFIIDLENKKLLFHTFVSHGRGSGTATATVFSNQPESYKSSLGFYTTGVTYNGHHGYSLRLNGEEKGINDNALARGIVMHAAAYVNEALVRSQGYIGRSQGCPAVPEALHKDIIATIKDGTCLFIYSNDKNYAAHTSFKDSTAPAALLADNSIR